MEISEDVYDQTFFDHRYDSVSEISLSTVADSDFVAQQIQKYKRENNQQTVDESAVHQESTIYNLRIDKLIIDGSKLAKKFCHCCYI